MEKKQKENTDIKLSHLNANSSHIKSLINNGEVYDLNEIISKTECDIELFDILWEKCNWKQRNILVSGATFHENLVQLLSDSQIEQIILQNDINILRWLSLEIYSFLYPGQYTKVNDTKSRRCSKVILNKLIKHIVKFSDSEIRENIKVAAEQKRIYDHNPWMLNGLDC